MDNPGFIPVCSPVHDAATMQRLRDLCVPRLQQMGLPEAREPNRSGVLIFLVLSGGTEPIMQGLCATQKAPVWLIAIPHHNSLAASMEFMAARRNQGRAGRIFYWDPQAQEPGNQAEELRWALRTLQAHQRMGGARLGLIGQPSDWLLTSPADAKLVKKAWGPELISIPSGECLRQYDQTAAVASTPASMGPAQRMQQALERLIATQRLDALTIRCFDLLGARDVTACLALARLNDAQIPSACEGDIPSALGMMWLHYLWDTPVWMANPSRLHMEQNALTLAHCSVPLRLTSQHGWDTHFESGRGLAVAGQWASDEATLFRLGGAQLEEWWCAQGRVLERGRDPNLCRTQIKVELDDPAALADLIRRPLGNHLLVIPGRKAVPLQAALALRAQLATGWPDEKVHS